MAAVWILFSLLLFTPAKAQQNNTQSSEVYLSFQYRGVVGVYVTTFYKNNQFYLPVSELFNLLQINHQVDQGTLTISGNYLGEKEYIIKLSSDNPVARAGDTEIQLEAEDYMVQEIDYFIKPYIFEELFGLKFTTNFNNLTLDLETVDKMPVVAQYEREQERQQLNQQEPLYDRDYYPLRYDRNYGTIDGAFIDYNLSGVYSPSSQLFTFSNAIGAELLAGDVQGNIFGAFSGEQNSVTTSGLRWRYVQRNNNLFSSATVGQTNTEGISSRAITGIKISNKPVEPRRLFQRYVVDGNTSPQSEVELYLNNRLVDYQEADQAGNYRFTVPLTYGSTNYSVRIFTPSGQQIERSSRIQIPFDYLPAGEVDYSLSGGQLNNPVLGSTERGYMGEATVSTGVTDWLTAQASSEYLTEYHSSLPSLTGTLNARLFSNYLVSANVNSENFYSLSSSVVYGSGASWSMSYDYNPGNSRLYNISGSDHQARANLFTPFEIGNIPLNMRWSSTYQQSGSSRLLRYRADLNTRLGRLNVRFGYQDQQAGNLSLTTTSASRITNSYTYSLGRYNDIPGLFRSMFLGGQVSYLPGIDEFEEMEFQISRDLMQTGRVQLSFGHNFLANYNSLSLNVTIDLNNIRSNTTSRYTGSEPSVTQSFRGSIGYDPYGDQLILNNRQQVGQSGAAVRLFVDNNNDGSYQDSTDQVITDPAVRLNRSGGKTSVKNGINYISQLLPYYRYDIEINKGALSNPLLVPDIENFSIVTDPNQFKTIEVPFYQSGVISGRVERKQDSTRQGLSGVRLYLESDYQKSGNREAFSKELRTFSDGSFYTYEVPPGKYNLFIDPSQLEFLNGVSKPDTMNIEVESLAQGDFIEGLNFTVIPKQDTTKAKPPVTTPGYQTSKKETINEQELYYEIQLASFQTRKKAEQVAMKAAEKLGRSFSVIQNTNNGLYAIRSVPFPQQNNAIENIISYHNSNYKSAALVVLKNKQEGSEANKTKFIQIGAFSTKQRAESFANSSTQRLDNETAVTYNKKQELYKVYINKTYTSDQERLEELESIRNYYSFRNIFINERGKIQLGAFDKETNARDFESYSRGILRREVELFYDIQTGLYNVFIDENCSESQRQTALKNIQNAASPFNDAFVSVYQDSATLDNLQPNRAMKFTFQVQVEGITEQSEQAFLSSIQSSDANLSRPKKDLIVFDRVATWDQAQEFQRKLQKISSIGHPIVVLIEESSTQQ